MTTDARPTGQGPTGDPGPGIDALIERHLPSLNAFVRVRTGPKLGTKESISDLVQSTCREVLRTAEKLPELDEAGFKYWLFTMAERKILNKVRHWEAGKRDVGREAGGMSIAEEQQLLRSYGGFHSPSHAAVLGDEIERVESALQDLPGDYRDVIVLHHVVGLPHREIAARMDRSEAAVRQLLSKALARLVRILRTKEKDAGS
ncbi:MAG: sigma-70 family RNA polymerase sigma factor [Planctomycetota bacterium]